MTATTSARPIISAVAVAAVRARVRAGRVGRQAPLDREEQPQRPARARRTSGRITNGATSAIPKKIAIVPAIPAAATTVVDLVGGAEPERPGEADADQDQPEHGPRGPAGGRAAPRCPSTARIGEVRPARRAG